MRFAFLILSLLLAAPAAAQQPRGFAWKVGDKNAPANSAQAAKDGFGVMMLVTADPEGFWKAWQGATPPQLQTTTRVTRDQPVQAELIFSGCSAAADGNCNVTAELSMTGPSGAPYGETATGKVWSGPPAPGYNLQLSQSGLGFILEPQDPLGVYVIKAAVTDHVAGRTLHVQQSITAVAPTGK
ncbi:MAG TPA: hypothetical protein VGB70_04165 [Allosphingosinicella sp.]|jgi:hypothetical protein